MMLLALGGEAGSETVKKFVSKGMNYAGKYAGTAAVKKLPNQAFKEINKMVPGILELLPAFDFCSYD